MIISVIPAKGSSSRLKNKNMRFLLKKPLIYWTIKHALESKFIDKIYVSTDSDKIAKFAKKMKVGVIKRPKKLCGEIPIFDVYKHAYQKLVKKNKVKIIVGLQPDHPDRTITVDKVISIFKNRKLDALFSCDEKKIKNGSYYLIKKNILEGKKVKKKFTVLDNCTNIHYLADLKKIEKKFNEKKIKYS